ncbi:hypothetical protein Terro_3381 [Terriglobus roseus DSM 18391]|uniref:Uncharacterized protein n=1 Tax=Terriglobus roseus (strain DSM 18391 / NRRL B-41598 / KBS 63) TaxID=926566 RepID=I3ZK28_TERRK|nr:hypothetical protein Terro_3381 [Terriglobus roseus DSM 18391]
MTYVCQMSYSGAWADVLVRSNGGGTAVYGVHKKQMCGVLFYFLSK